MIIEEQNIILKYINNAIYATVADNNISTAIAWFTDLSNAIINDDIESLKECNLN